MGIEIIDAPLHKPVIWLLYKPTKELQISEKEFMAVVKLGSVTRLQAEVTFLTKLRQRLAQGILGTLDKVQFTVAIQ